VNISGIDTEVVQRGDVVVHPNQYQPTRRLDARLRLLQDSSSAVRHNSEVKFFVGASETVASLRLLGKEELNPGEEAWIQLELRNPVVTVRGDRYILRRPSPGETIGGGVIVDHQPRGRHKRFDEEVLRSLESLAQGTPADVLFEAALALHIASLKEVVTRSRLEANKAVEALQELLDAGSLVPLEGGTPVITNDLLVISRPHWNALRQNILQIVAAYHSKYPLRRGIPREELKSRLKLPPRPFNAAISKLIADQSLADSSAFLALPGHRVEFDSEQQAKVSELIRTFEQNPFSPPSLKEIQQDVGDEILNALIDSGTLVPVSADILFQKTDYDLMVERIQNELIQKGQITLSEVRDLFNTSRKYAQALLEYLDSTGVTVREGDFRKLRRR
jgi:selenocysteine-specific elongation factor